MGKLDTFNKIGNALLGLSAGIKDPASLMKINKVGASDSNTILNQAIAIKLLRDSGLGANISGQQTTIDEETRRQMSQQAQGRMSSLRADSGVDSFRILNEPIGNNFGVSKITSTGPTIENIGFEAEKKRQLAPIETAAKVQEATALIDPAVKKQEALIPGAVEEQTAKEIAKLNLKRDVLANDLETFFAVDNAINRAEGGFLDRLIQGGKTTISSLKQGTPEGAAAAAHDALRKRLRVSLVRAAGDVGNINIIEQLSAEKILPGFFDTEKTAEIKKAILKDISKAVDSKDPEKEIYKVMRKFAQSELYDNENPIDFNSVEQANSANLPSGTIISINGRRARVD